MSFPPNIAYFDSLINELDREYNIPVRLSRYKSAAPELLTLAIDAGLSEDEASRALFVADFITTSSEVPSGASDEDRYQSVFKAFILGRSRNTSVDKLMHVFYVAYKTAIKIRSQDLFMGGRGVAREVSLVRLKDYFITPYLHKVGMYLSKNSCSWELGLLAAALKRTWPHEEIQEHGNVPDYTSFSDLNTHIWSLLKQHEFLHSVSQNPSVTITNLNTSEALLVFDHKNPSSSAIWNIPKELNVSRLQATIQQLTTFLDKKFLDCDIIMLKGRMTNTLEHGFLFRDPLVPNRPIFFLKSSADDLNAMNLSQVLHLRGLEEVKSGTWKKTLSTKEKKISPPPKPTTKESLVKELVKEPEQKKGFFGRLLSKFRKEGTPSQKPIGYTEVQKQIKSKPKIKKGKLLTEAGFIPQALVIEAVSNLPIVDTFDTLREGNYQVEGIFETELRNNVTTFLSRANLNISSKVMTFLKELKPLYLNVLSEVFSEGDFNINEIFFTSEQYRYLLKLDHSMSMEVGLLARTPPDASIDDYHSRSHEIDHLQRKSLAMRTNQYLKARRHSSLEDAIERIYGQNFVVSSVQKDVIG
jgi:hypothetical protein